jgi:hypothetical protein
LPVVICTESYIIELLGGSVFEQAQAVLKGENCWQLVLDVFAERFVAVAIIYNFYRVQNVKDF